MVDPRKYHEQIKYPFSFWLLIGIVVLTAALTVVWNFTHFMMLLALIGAQAGLRFVSHWESRNDPKNADL
jgi:hypothetical protein